MNKNLLGNAWDIVETMATDETKEMFELDDILYGISIKIFDYRTNKGWTQKQLAEVLGVKQSMVSKLESGEYNPTIEQLWKISKKLGWNFKVVLDEKDETETQIWDTVDTLEDQIASNMLDKLVKNA